MHFVRCLASEGCMRHLEVVRLQEDRDQRTNVLDGVYGVEEKPLMFQGAPPRLDHRVGFGWSFSASIQMPSGLCQYLTSRSGIKPGGYSPSHDLPGEVVDDGMDVYLGAVEQLYDGNIDMPGLVRAGSTDAYGGFGGVNAKPMTPPATLAYQSRPCGGGGEDFSNSLCVDAERAQGHVSVLRIENHTF